MSRGPPAIDIPRPKSVMIDYGTSGDHLRPFEILIVLKDGVLPGKYSVPQVLVLRTCQKGCFFSFGGHIDQLRSDPILVSMSETQSHSSISTSVRSLVAEPSA